MSKKKNWAPAPDSEAKLSLPRLLLNKEKEPRSCLANAIIAARTVYRVKFNQFAQRIETEAGEEWGDVATINVAAWLHHNGIFVSSSVAGEAIAKLAHEHAYHPVRDYLRALEWDGTPRVDTWLVTYLGAEDSAYARAVGARWLISAVARIYRPGAKADCCLILEGPQGSGKSTALRKLAGEFFTDEIADLGTKDAALQCAGAWIIELSELDAMSRAEVAKVKSFMSRNTDRFRPPYGRSVITLGRQCVFAGTTNSTEYLKDETGGRRFWPVTCKKIDLAALARDRNQLWAEAKTRFEADEPWWLDARTLVAAAAEEQRSRYVEDVWTEPIGRYLDSLISQDVSIAEILIQIGRPTADQSQSDQNRVARCLKRLGWERKRRRVGGDLEWRYRRSGPTVPTVPSSETHTGNAI